MWADWRARPRAKWFTLGRAGRPRIKHHRGLLPGRCPQERGHRPVRPLSEAPWWGVSDVTALLAFLLLIVMLVIGARVRGVRDSFWKFLAFVVACVVVLALLLAILAK